MMRGDIELMKTVTRENSTGAENPESNIGGKPCSSNLSNER